MKSQRKASTYTWPIALGLLSSVGLLSALLGDGAWDWLSWVSLGLPTLLCGWIVMGAPRI